MSVINLTLEERAPYSNLRYGREKIGMGNAFADYFKPHRSVQGPGCP